MKRLLAAVTALSLILAPSRAFAADYIKWVDFNVCSEALCRAAKLDTESGGEISWISLLAMLACDYGGSFGKYKNEDLDRLASDYGENLKKYSEKKLFRYYSEAYAAVLGGFLGEHLVYSTENGVTTVEESYGVCAYSPIAEGYYYNDFDDFGASRSYGYKRAHLGHDLMGSVGTPVIAIEGGYVECAGWNQYGGWRIGIRSFDGKRYYYYAHLRKNHPYADIYEGKTVSAGEVIGYLGMTGYSAKENTNNINVPHLHLGMELIFDPSQKDGYCQIWINMYEVTKFLSAYRAGVTFVEEEGEYKSLICSVKPEDWE